MSWYSKTWNWIDGEWIEGNPMIMGPRSHASWMASSVFDGARIYEGVSPDLDLHCQRVNRSVDSVGLMATMKAEDIEALALEGAKKFGPDAAIYVKPMYWAEEEGYGTVSPKAEGTRFCLCLFDAPMPSRDQGFTVTLSPFRRPTMECMPTDAKTGALYPNNARALREAKSRGFDNALLRDMLGNIAETASSNVFMVKGGTVFMPAANGTFLNGITRQRVTKLLRDAGVEVVETTLRYEDFETAEEIFSTGNYSKVVPILKIDNRNLSMGPVTRKAYDLYREFAHSK
ncbi:branched-chain amino acid aminotransferase [Microvirga sp. W0021]|uniref:Probable branched-chain-amino-acid aminotransferase n=1 Tax=Hohaiivirga grylli TaxID=3133970 RepID=A0ABV0BJF7_9HYPH